MLKTIRVSELSRELDVETSFVLELLRRNGVGGWVAPSTAIADDIAQRIREELGRKDNTPHPTDASTIWEFFPEQQSEVDLESDNIARLNSLAQEVANFREAGPLEPMVA